MDIQQSIRVTGLPIVLLHAVSAYLDLVLVIQTLFLQVLPTLKQHSAVQPGVY